MSGCVDHLEFTNAICPDCGLKVDGYGNTEDRPWDYCTFPDCGCDGARLCQAGEANEYAGSYNVEGMWLGKKPEHKKARTDFVNMTIAINHMKNLVRKEEL